MSILTEHRVLGALLAFLIAALTGCGGGTQVAEGGISGTGKSLGPISGIGSIISNGIEFEDGGALVTINGMPGTSSELQVGMVVAVSGSFDTAAAAGSADSISFDYSLAGRVTGIDGAIESNGQMVVVNGQTALKAVAAADLAVGDYILVSGFVRPGGELLATYLERRAVPPVPGLIVDGIVDELDTAARSFTIKNRQREATGQTRQLVQFSAATLTGFEAGQPDNGSHVHIEGAYSGSTIVASHVSNLGDGIGAGDDFVLQGVAESEVVQQTFELSGRSLSVDADTQVSNGALSDIQADRRVQVYGHFAGATRLIADSIRLLEEPTATIDAPVTAVNLQTGTLTLLGGEVRTDSLTVFIDGSSQNVRSFSLANIQPGDRVVLNVYRDGVRTVATQVARLDGTGGEPATIEGPLDAAIADPLIAIVGIDVDTSGVSGSSGFSLGDLQTLTRTQFFQTVRAGMNVRVTGQPVGSTLVPDTVTLVSCCNFTMLDGNGHAFGGANDMVFVWDGSLYTDPVTQTLPNIQLASASSAPFFGFPWTVHGARVFGPGSYSFETLAHNTLTLDVGPDQIGAHLLFNWGPAGDSDAVLIWNKDSSVQGEVYQGSPGAGAPGQVFALATADGDGDGVPGIAFVDGAFAGFRMMFNLSAPPP